MSSFLIKKKVPSSRFTILLKRDKVINKLPSLKRLLKRKKKSGGRNNVGHMTVYTKGGGHKQKYRLLTNSKENLTGIVEAIEYAPNRTGDVARIFNLRTKIHEYIIAPQHLKRGNLIMTTKFENDLSFKIGNSYQLKELPLGMFIYDLPFPFSKKKAIQAAGCKGILVSKDINFCRVKLCSGEYRIYLPTTFVSLGSVSNPLHKLQNLGKAGRSRWLGRRPLVRGVAMNPIDHPHGGGEGKTSGGRPSVTPWGKVAKGQPTRKNKVNKYRIIN